MSKLNKETRERIAAWWTEFKEQNNETFLPLFFCKSRILLMKGGGGSGKSIVAGRKILERCAQEPGHRFLVVRKVATTIDGSCFHQLVAQANRYYSGEINKIIKSPMNIKFANGSEIIFSGLDDAEKLKSIHGVTGIWVEEASEIEESDLNQLMIRLRDKSPYYKQIILTFNPVSVTHWLKKSFWDRHDPRAVIHESTYKDNRFLEPSEIRTLELFRETDEYFYMVYCLGQWGVTGRTVFNAKLISERIEADVKPVREGYFTVTETDAKGTPIKWEWTDDARNALIRIYREPKAYHPYVIGGDTAGDGSDRFVGQVMDNAMLTQDAVLIMTTGEAEYCKQMYCLGKYYQTALLAIEANFSSYPNNLLQSWGYPKLYVRQSLDAYTGKTVEKFGFMTTTHTRNTIIARLIRYVNEHSAGLCDRETLAEMLTFVRNEQFRPEAQDGAHDDTVMALAIALECGAEQQDTETREPEARVEWEDWQWDDYRRASSAERKEMIRDWGLPKK